jgi:hypothetical protein
MGRRTEIDNDDDEQQSTSSTSSSLNRLANESQMNTNRNLDEEKFDDDTLIHDTILPHRKRVRRDTLLSIQQQHYVQPQPMTTSCKIEDVSLFTINLYVLICSEKKIEKVILTCANAIFLYKLYNNIHIKLTLNAL